LHPGVEPLLGRLGVADEVLAAGFLRHEGHWVTWAGPRRFAAFGRDEDVPGDFRKKRIAIRKQYLLLVDPANREAAVREAPELTWHRGQFAV
jgi:hypothetical protein